MQESSHIHHDEENSAQNEQEGQGRAFSPWSDDSSSNGQSEDACDTKITHANPLRELMYNIESMQDQLARISVAICRSGMRSRLQKADQRFEATEHEELEGHLVGMLLTQLKCCPQERDSSKLNEVQLRLQHSRGLDAGPTRRENRKVGLIQEEMVEGKKDSKPSNAGSKHANSTIVWNQKHIADDLSPYTCIAADCDQPHVLFNTKEAWRQHILKDHSSLTYWICFACGDGSQFNDKSAFVQHTKSNHAATIPPDQIPVLCGISKKITPTGLERCPLCNWPEEEGVMMEKDVLLNHIAKEIHSFSLRALPWADDNGQESDERICDSSEKVYEWLIQSEIPGNSGKERPTREERFWHSQHFQQNPYFASSSKASSSSGLDSNGSRGNELEELRKEGESIVHESSEAWPSSEPDSNGSRENELEELGEEGESIASRIRNMGDIRLVPDSTMFNPENYTVGWICAITAEYVAAQEFLDERHFDPAYQSPLDTNDYTLGRIGNHNVVISVRPTGAYGSFSAARVATDMLRSFPNIRICVMVGIGSGVPSQKHDIRLGDIVVGIELNDQSAVLQCDFGKTVQGQSFKPIGFLDQPPILRRAVYGLQAQYEHEGHKLDDAVNKIIERKPRLRKKCQRPDPASDRLYQSHILHLMDSGSPCAILCGDDPSCLVSRSPRTEYDDNPAIHYGLIASANQIMKDASMRDELAAQKDILCIEMEAAGMMNHFPCLVIRGICDYADSHKNKDWQWYAAMVSAAYTKDILRQIVPQQVVQEAKSLDILKEGGDHVFNPSWFSSDEDVSIQ
ncbi:hypothetical protein N7449_003112 [Penicillium cf. viridicatum]|uniref:C2H2-type domain-containing protein n=1 Tax=Penicillium cf. viridicatum TaxID=2972119 RepID=A0A9W9MWS0_9EURO|nr:hypothetical protein N7449_003112 [Penicillium cf. viridicatum]